MENATDAVKRQGGFTLLEIIAVLVLLGILSAVAAPRFFDLQQQARMRVAQATLAEIQARINQAFAKELLMGTACDLAITNAIAEARDASDWGSVTLNTLQPKSTSAPEADFQFTINGDPQNYANGIGNGITWPTGFNATIYLPQCSS